MRSSGIACLILFLTSLAAGCIQVPGIPVIPDAPDPVVGQWIGGEPPETDMHIVFYENGTFLSISFFIGRGQETDRGTWTKTGRGSYSTLSGTGTVTNWTYDSSADTVYASNIPQRKYHRFRG